VLYVRRQRSGEGYTKWLTMAETRAAAWERHADGRPLALRRALQPPPQACSTSATLVLVTGGTSLFADLNRRLCRSTHLLHVPPNGVRLDEDVGN